MSEPISSIFTVKGLVVLLGFLFSGIANATLEVKKNGWKGIWVFGGNVLVAVMAGQIIYSFLVVAQPEYALPIGFAAAYTGPNAVKLLWNGFVTTLKLVK